MSYSMTLAELLSILPESELAKQSVDLQTLSNVQINDLVLDSRQVKLGTLFIAYPGLKTDGRTYIEAAIANGASAIVYEPFEDGDAVSEAVSVPMIAIQGIRQKVGLLANQFFQQPSSDMQVFGVTGTNGKTTCCYLLTQALTTMGMKAAMMGTIGVGELSSLMGASHTTPDPISVHRLLAQWRDQGITQVCMEVSSHALDQGRVNGVRFFCTLFTNLSHDHLDYHGDMTQYAAAKRKLFTDFAAELVITNADDDMGAGLIDVANSGFIASYGDNGDVRLQEIELAVGGMVLHLEAGDADFSVACSLIGTVNIPNVLLVVTTLLSLSTSTEEIQRVVSELKSAPGRMELYVAENFPSVVVDYAHTPDALERALNSLAAHCQGQLWCVFGCGGDRDVAKRSLMGEIATRLADKVILTNDNPRSEKPKEIIADIKVGIHTDKADECAVVLDRAKAIRSAIEQATADDWVLIAGKGHELTQTIADNVIAFSDREQVSNTLGGGDMMQLAQIAAAVDGHLIGADQMLQGVTTDSRGDCQHQLFVALKGERFDAHDYLQQAHMNGAVAVMVSQACDIDIPCVRVKDTRQALKDLAAWWRAQFVIPVVGITGSVGKTSVKEMLAAIFAEIGDGLVTKGNLNNEIGVPLTLLRLDPNDQYAIVEMGMNHAGEISRLTAMAKPTIALVNNAAAAHLEGLGSVEGVAKAKGEIFEGLSEDGIGIVNADDQYAGLWRELIGSRRVMSFGLSEDADVTASYELSNDGVSMQVTTPQHSFAISMTTVGKHNVMNALAAIAVATAANIPMEAIQTGLNRYRPINGRLNISKIGGVTLIDDTYNANPASMSAAIEVLAQYGHSILVVGDMAELGDAAKEEHRLIGEFAKQNQIDKVFACGEFAEFVMQGFSGQGGAFEKQTELTATLMQMELFESAVLVKGSRSAKMERVVESLLTHFNQLDQLNNQTSNGEGRASC